MKKQRGFSLVELLVSILLAMTLLTAAYSVYFGASRVSKFQTQIARMQDNARMAMDVLAQNFRRAGFTINYNNYPIGTTVGGLASKIVPVNSTTGPDSVSLAGIPGSTVHYLTQEAAPGSRTLYLDTASGVTTTSVIALSYTHSALVNKITGTGTVELDTAVPAGSLQMKYYGPTAISHGTTTVKQPAEVVALTSTRFYIDKSDPAHPTLYQDSFPLAEDIEDLQIAYGVDINNNNVIDPGEWTSTPATYNVGGISMNATNLIYEVRITIVARTSQEDRGWESQSRTITAEDHTNNFNDKYHRFVLTRIVKCRNARAFMGGAL